MKRRRRPPSRSASTVLCVVLASSMAMAVATPAAAIWMRGAWGRHLHGHPTRVLHSPVAIGDQGPPPPITPAMYRVFVELLASYEAFGANIPVSFGEWIVMNGITDLRTQWSLMWLWWNLHPRSAVD